jgi:hypothetical protein
VIANRLKLKKLNGFQKWLSSMLLIEEHTYMMVFGQVLTRI